MSNPVLSKKLKPEKYDIVAGILLFIIPFSTALPNILLVPLGLLMFYQIFKQNKNTIHFTPPVFFFTASVATISIIAVFKGSFISEIDIYLRYFAAILLVFIYQNVSNIKTVENFYLVSLTIATFLSIVKIIRVKIEFPGLLFDTGPVIDQVLWENRPLAAFMLVLGIFICLRRASFKSFNHWFFYALAIFFFMFCNYISARLSLLLAVATIIYFLFFRLHFKKKVKIIATILFFIGVSTILLINKSLISRTPFDNQTQLERIIEIVKDREPRAVIWNCSSILLKTDSNALFGTSSYKKYRQDLVNCYGETIVNREEKRAYYMESRFNSHNQFLDFWLNGGILPFVLLLAVFLAAFFSRKIPADAKWIFFLFFCFFLVENVLYRQMGYYLFGIFVALYQTKTLKKIKA